MPDSAPAASPPKPDRPHEGKSWWRVDPAPDGRGAPPQQRPPLMPRQRRGTFAAILLGLLAVNFVLALVTSGPAQRTRVPYEPFFIDQVRVGNVQEISSKDQTIDGTLKRPATYVPPNGKSAKVDKFTTQVPAFVDTTDLTKLLDQRNVVVNAAPPDSGRSAFWTLILGFGPTILLVALFIYLGRRMSAGGALGGFGRSQARRVERDGTMVRVTFDDVAGIDEAENELVEIVDFLKNPQRYQRLGARIPRGVLLYGPPGTGKTLLARAVAGEAEAAFFSISASEFVEAIVGVGASRVRDLFKQAKEAAPSIVFIDELDAIGRSRSAGGFSGGHDEREQTLNQILTEMDGFEPGTNVIVLGATNRPEILDPALLRPGRFDRRIAVQPPDKHGRAEILRIHTRSVPLAESVDLEAIAASTPGMTGADLALLVNEAALFAARRGHDRVEPSDFTDAIEKIILGTERALVMSKADRERTAYHESGHALVGMLTRGADPVRKISIIPRGQALGVTLSTPEADRYGYEREELLGKIKVALGGRMAERLVYGETTTGAESDIQQLTQIARGMVGRWGMSDAVGPIAVADGRSDGMLLPGQSPTSEATQRLVDEEVRRIVDEAEHDTLMLLERERPRLEALARALLVKETLDQIEAYDIAGVPMPEAAAQEPARA
ncbi:MAG: cell division protease FtsH [Solirubrobacteraceae bacterium]|nr:cell division protease FtsH [Solirubrobacteraceae bacterium]MEA2276894.1 cell division protease FtsH [Solirubrobacteraceae bacterium]MEA2358884.1 cell division protease FtsH [Solirubrobacteraceae bacterium]